MNGGLGNSQAFLPVPEKGPVGTRGQQARAQLASGLRGLGTPRQGRCRLKRVAKSVQIAFREAVSGDSRFVVRGIETCGSVHACPMCSARILAQRSGELSEAIQSWSPERVAMATFTLRHRSGMGLSLLRRLLAASYTRLKAGRTGTRLKKELHWRGDVRGAEVTHSSANGWHPHIHAIWFFETAIDASQIQDELAVAWRMSVEGTINRWLDLCDELDNAETWDDRLCGAVLRAWGSRFSKAETPQLAVKSFRGEAGKLLSIPAALMPSLERGVDVLQWRDGEGGRAARYIAKMGLELTGITAKSAKQGSRTAWQIGHDAANGCAASRRLWSEYCRATHGSRQLTWSRGLRDKLGLGDELSDQDIAKDEHPPAEAEETMVAEIPADVWDRNVKDQGVLAALYRNLEQNLKPLPGAISRNRHRIIWDRDPPWTTAQHERAQDEERRATQGFWPGILKIARDREKAKEREEYERWFMRQEVSRY